MVLPARGLISHKEDVVSPYSISPHECFTSSGLFLVCVRSTGTVIRNLPETAGALWLRYCASHAAITCSVVLRAPYFTSQFSTPLPEYYMTSQKLSERTSASCTPYTGFFCSRSLAESDRRSYTPVHTAHVYTSRLRVTSYCLEDLCRKRATTIPFQICHFESS